MSVYNQPSVSNSTSSLSSRLRLDATRELGTPSKKQLPSLSTKSVTSLESKFSSSSNSLSPIKGKRDLFTRLSGLPDTNNTTGLFSEQQKPSNFSSLCVRCGRDHAALCMPCSEKDSEIAVTFYRKTKAAGAAALFSKAFVEAGYRKVLKFVVFRLLRNSFEVRTRQHIKKRTVVEKLFGTNLVYLPFTAWRRYTKENIVERKNRQIEQMNEKIKLLESQINKLNYSLNESMKENEKLKQDLTQKENIINTQKEEIKIHKIENSINKKRILSLSYLVIPLEIYSTALDHIMHQKISETSAYLHKSTTQYITYDDSSIYPSNSFEELSELLKTLNNNSPAVPRGPTIHKSNIPTRQFSLATQFVMDWANHYSQLAGEHIEQATGQILNNYLPKHVDIETISEIRHGKVLSRLIVGIIYDRREVLANESVQKTFHSYYHTIWPEISLSIEEIQKFHSLESHTLDLITYSLNLAKKYLNFPNYRPIEIFSGKAECIHHILLNLMNLTLPLNNQQIRKSIETKINSYYHISNDLETLQQNKPSLISNLKRLYSFYQEEYDVQNIISANNFLPKNKYVLHRLSSISQDPNDNLSSKSRGVELQLEVEATNDLDHDECFNDNKTTNQTIKPFQPLQTESKEISDDLRSQSFKIQSIPITSTKKSILVDPTLAEANHLISLSTPFDSMSQNQYLELIQILDHCILHHEHLNFMELAQKAFKTSQEILTLQSDVSHTRDIREDSMSLTSDIRQLIYSELLNYETNKAWTPEDS